MMLPKMKCQSEGSELLVKTKKGKLVFKDVVVGEVWHASGQSNMGWALRHTGEQGEAAIKTSDVSAIRFFKANLTTAASEQNDVGGAWRVSHPEVSANFSAVAYHFALKLHEELDVPVGIVQTAWGGKPVETFTRREALAAIPGGKRRLNVHDKSVADYDEAKDRLRFIGQMKKWEENKKKWEATPPAERVGKLPRRPRAPQNPALIAGRPATIWNGMVAPLAGYTQRGAIWYQGESNRHEPDDYGSLFTAMIEDWREVWEDDFRYLWVQLADFTQPVTKPGTNDGWAVVQEYQRRTLSLPKTGMAVINDIGDATDIHPKNKKDVGERLARWALADDYGKDVVKSGPLYQAHKVEGSGVIVSFEFSNGLKSRDGKPLKHFEIQSETGKWYWAEAAIKGEVVVVSHKEVKKPKAVRYAWAANPAGSNLVNGEGLPASLFTTEW